VRDAANVLRDWNIGGGHPDDRRRLRAGGARRDPNPADLHRPRGPPVPGARCPAERARKAL